MLRLLGMSRGMLSRLVLGEGALCGLLGGLIGIALAAALIFPFTALIEQSLGLPYLSPGAGWVLLLAAGTLLASALAGALASAFAARRLSQADPGTTLREGA